MYNYRSLYITLLVILLTSVGAGAWSQTLLYTDSELDVLMAPIALYPDPLIAQMLPAATYHDQLVNANYYVSRDGPRNIDGRDWDVSVRSIAYYPGVLRGMANKPNWTIAIGQAYVNEPTHVMWSIQRLRKRARSYGYLTTNRYQRVYSDGGYYRIVPVQPRYIYVPQYNPQIVYVQRRSSSTSNLISFGLGLLIGSWLNRDVDWHRHRVYYHGWDDDGWVRNSRRHVTINNYYVSNDYRDRPISVDRSIRTRDLGDFRTVIRQSASSGTYRLPASRQSGRSGTLERRDRPQQRSVTGRTTQDSSRVNRSERDRGLTKQSGKTRTPSVRNAPSSKRSVTRSDTRPAQSNIRKDTSRRTKSPSIKTAPRSSQQKIRSGAKSDRTVTKSRSTSGTKKVSTRSGSKASGKGKDGRSKDDSKRR